MPKRQRTDSRLPVVVQCQVLRNQKGGMLRGDDDSDFMSSIAVVIPAVIVTIIQPRTYRVLNSRPASDCLYVITSSPRLLLYSYILTTGHNLHTWKRQISWRSHEGRLPARVHQSCGAHSHAATPTTVRTQSAAVTSAEWRKK